MGSDRRGCLADSRKLAWFFIPLGIVVLLGCNPPAPIRIGFVGGTSGRVADLGIAGRDAVLLAVELRNRAGGIAGRKVELLIRDDEQKSEVAQRVTRELIAQGVVAIIGPMTSAMAVAMAPVVNEARVPLISPTVVTNELTDRNDYFLRVSSPTREYVRKIALHERNARGLRRVTAVYDLDNRAYTESWLNDFRAAFAESGGEIIQAIGFQSGSDTAFLRIANDLLAPQPDGVVIVANSVDTAMFCQQIRKLDARIPLVGSEWGATERLTELGGKAVEGLTVAQIFDRNNTAPGYRVFRQIYFDRFRREPGFGGVAAFDAANVVLEALARHPAKRNLKETILTLRRFKGLQQPVVFDEFGETRRDSVITVVRDGEFVVIE
ncbi:MAG: ABC transporter substrate-binding protein [Candidatus Contendobacter sp.]|nr:ABC transporter substrate-binding protein [Candidatus Contendobacter sp.]MDG4558438.1 ABC transporter substrate-binding protein [Candidatus Contendobacter sp.]